MSLNTEYPTIETNTSLGQADDYAEILQFFNLKYKRAGYYWQVGKIEKTQGWILHVSVVLSQAQQMFEAILPFLIKEGVAFKIVADESICGDLLSGNHGLAQIGKIASIYAASDLISLNLAKKLIELTMAYKGPAIPTDIHLGNIVYTRYGSFNPIIKLDAQGIEEKYIYDGEGQLMKDSYGIPFQMPPGVTWPFHELAAPVLPEPPKLLNRTYKLLSLLKPDPRGNVFKGIYLKKLLQVKHCVFKQGYSNMESDKAGRDIRDRLAWQYELYKDLSAHIPMPAIYALFQEETYAVLVMQFIDGHSLYDKMIEINPFSKSWLDLSVRDSLKLLKYAIELTKIIDTLHKIGYVHRDIVPVNFLVDKKDNIVLIDMELAYSLKQNRPTPPFAFGTAGFMSPEQMALHRPTIKEDIYGIGATLLFIFTGLTPVRFNTKDTKALVKSLNFFIGNKELAKLIANSLSHDPKLRPELNIILEALLKYQQELKTTSLTIKQHSSAERLDKDKLKEIISTALDGMSKTPIPVVNDLWYSKQITIENHTAPKNKEYALSTGTSEGIAGVLYVLAQIKKAGIDIDPCRAGFMKGWQVLGNLYFNHREEITPGLYKGGAGFALALAEGIHSALLEDSPSNREIIQSLLDSNNDKLDLATGIAGLGFSLMKCESLLSRLFYESSLDKIMNHLLNTQQKNGSWMEPRGKGDRKANKTFDIGYDDTGIVLFLLKYISLSQNTSVHNSITSALTGILKNKGRMDSFYTLVASKNTFEIGDGGRGMIFMLIKAYEILQEKDYKKLAENALMKYPYRIVHNNFTQQNGLAGLGEIYLEASRVFQNEEWKRRADWIANVYIHAFSRNDDSSGCWIMEENNPPTADFLTGNSGITHFLVRCLHPDSLGYSLLN